MSARMSDDLYTHPAAPPELRHLERVRLLLLRDLRLAAAQQRRQPRLVQLLRNMHD